MKNLLFIIIGLLSFSSYALDVSQCPNTFNLSVTTNTIFKKYLNDPQTLKTVKPFVNFRMDYTFQLNKKLSITECFYTENGSNTATIKSAPVRNYEDGQIDNETRLTFTLEAGGVEYRLFYVVEEMDPYTLMVFANDRSNPTKKIMTILENQGLTAIGYMYYNIKVSDEEHD